MADLLLVDEKPGLLTPLFRISIYTVVLIRSPDRWAYPLVAMDSKQRHDLETNDLREFIDNFKDFWDRNGNHILIVFMVVVGGYALYNLYNTWQTGKTEDAAQALIETSNPAALLTVAQDHELVFNEAMRRAGDQFHARARQHLFAGDVDEAKQDLEYATNTYQALADKTDSEAYRANAYLGLARVAESMEDWGKAEGYYKQAEQAAGEKYAFLANLAKQGLEDLETLRHPLPFGEDASPPVLPGPDTLPPDDGVPEFLRRPENAPGGESVPGESGEPIPGIDLNPGE